jgi:2-methylcitrate dehydratase PrpD
VVGATKSAASASARLSAWAAELHPRDIPSAIRRRAQTCLLDTIGVAIAGARGDAATFARAMCVEGGTQGWSTALGTNSLFSAQAAAFVNGTAAHALDFDDNCYAGFVHGSAVVAPAVLAVGQKVNATGAEAITAFAVAVECEYAIGAASQNVLYDQGWWTTGVLGPIGSSIAAARLLGLDSSRTHAALGLAMVSAGGMKACFGTDAKALMAGRASEAGVVCAELAARGASGPDRAIEDKNGFINLFNSGQFDHGALDGLGTHWYLESPGADIKRIPVCLSSHAAVDAVGELIAAHGIAVAQIESIVCDVPPIVQSNLKYDAPRTAREAQFSMPFAIAAPLWFGSLTLAQLNDQGLQDEGLRALMARVSMTTGPMWNDPQRRDSAPEGAHVCIQMRDGARIEAYCDKARGSAAHPLSPEQVADKFLVCAIPILGERRAAKLLANLQHLDSAVALRDVFLNIEFDTPA